MEYVIQGLNIVKVASRHTASCLVASRQVTFPLILCNLKFIIIMLTNEFWKREDYFLYFIQI